MALYNDGILSDEHWYLDSGETEDMTWHKGWFFTLTSSNKCVKIGVESILKDVGVGDIQVITNVNSSPVSMILKNVILYPDLKVNSFSVSSALDKGFTIFGDASKCRFQRDGKVFAEAERNVFLMDMKVDVTCAVPAMSNENSLKVWHERNTNHVKGVLKKF
ncbi:hypothetical protein JTB14_002373 [Gonioctena quinquepunctata]|nr:hypothetical protein JTB14_002373 [Gonioctena quinquepunctata]